MNVPLAIGSYFGTLIKIGGIFEEENIQTICKYGVLEPFGV